MQSTFSFYPPFQLPRALSHCKYEPLMVSLDFYLFCYKNWLCYLSVTCYISVIGISYNLSKYTLYKHNEKLFALVCFSCLHLHTVIVLHHLVRKGCSKFLRILVTAVQFTDRNWISKTMYSRKINPAVTLFLKMSLIKSRPDLTARRLQDVCVNLIT